MDPLIGLFEEDEMPDSLPPEVEEGNVEYKLKLVSPTESRFEHLVTQMKWRLQEGQGEAIYEIGVEDTGMLTGLTHHELQSSIDTLDRMASRLGATITVLREKQVETSGQLLKRVAEILVRKVPENQQFIDLRLAVLGNVDAGKSTLLGVLTQGELDNGRGRARLNLFRHLHEIQSGRTSSISHEILGFDSHGDVVNYSDSRTVEDICENSTKLITLIDLCGHHKYLKTTIFGLTGYSPDFAMLVVSANTGMVGTTREHLGFALALGVPIFVVVSKIDMCRRSQVMRTVRQLEQILKSPGCKKVPFRVETEDDALTAGASFHNDRNKFRLRIARSQEKLLESLGVRKSSSSSSTSSASSPPSCNVHSPENHLPVSPSRSDHVSSSSVSVGTSLAAVVGCCSKSKSGSDGEIAVAMATPVTLATGMSVDSGSCQPGPSQKGEVDVASVGVEARFKSVDDDDDDDGSICPIFTVSNVTGANIDLLTRFLNVLPPLHNTKERESYMQELSEHQVDEVYYIQGVGVVAWGNTLRGTIKEGDHLLLGPTEEGHFHSVNIHSIHRNRLPCRAVTAGQSACLSLGNFNLCPLRKGMVLVSPELNPYSCLEFEADIYVLFHTHYICKGFQTVIHVGNVMQTAIILRIDKKGDGDTEPESTESKAFDPSKEKGPDVGSLQTNEKAVVLFRFINRPEYIRVGSRLLFREGKTKGMGEVTKIYPIDDPSCR